MKLQDVCIRNEEIAGIQYFRAKKDDKGTITQPAYFDIILKSGATIHVGGGDEIYSKAVEQSGIE